MPSARGMVGDLLGGNPFRAGLFRPSSLMQGGSAAVMLSPYACYLAGEGSAIASPAPTLLATMCRQVGEKEERKIIDSFGFFGQGNSFTENSVQGCAALSYSGNKREW